MKKIIKVVKEWFIDAPWGKIALVSWGDPTGPPVLLVHGRQDSLSTFIPILEYLPGSHHYVGVDLPGHGKSDRFPVGVMLTRFHFIVAVDYVVRHLGWHQFVYIAHSMGCEQGLFFNAVYPNRITKFILFDPLLALELLQCRNYKEYYSKYYENYYRNYEKLNWGIALYTRREAIEAVMRARKLNESQAELVLDRNLIAVDGDKYRLSWDYRLRRQNTAPQNYPLDYYTELFSKNTPPTLIISATDSIGVPEWRASAMQLVTSMKNNCKHFYIENVKGGHDIHLTEAGAVATYVVPFLNTNFSRAKL